MKSCEKNYCLDCGSPVRCELSFCRKCCQKSENKGKGLKDKFCIDCNKKISKVSKRCLSCSRKGELSWSEGFKKEFFCGEEGGD